MPKMKARLHWLVLAVFLAACANRQAGTPTAPLPTQADTAVPAVPTETIAPAPSSTPTPGAAGEVTWETHAFTAGVSIELPAGWAVDPQASDTVYFRPPTPGVQQVRLEVYRRPARDRAMADPHSWEGNEAGYAVQWEKPLSVQAGDGIEFVWGVRRDNQWEGLPELMAVYYSARDELDVRLTTAFDSGSAELAQTLGLTETISTRFGIFEHMARSVRLGGAAATYTDPVIGYALGYAAAWHVQATPASLVVLTSYDPASAAGGVPAGQTKIDLAPAKPAENRTLEEMVVEVETGESRVLREERWELAGGVPAVRLQIQGQAAGEMALLLAVVNGRSLRLAGYGDLAAFDAVAKSLRVVSQAQTPLPNTC